MFFESMKVENKTPGFQDFRESVFDSDFWALQLNYPNVYELKKRIQALKNKPNSINLLLEKFILSF